MEFLVFNFPNFIYFQNMNSIRLTILRGIGVQSFIMLQFRSRSKTKMLIEAYPTWWKIQIRRGEWESCIFISEEYLLYECNFIAKLNLALEWIPWAYMKVVLFLILLTLSYQLNCQNMCVQMSPYHDKDIFCNVKYKVCFPSCWA